VNKSELIEALAPRLGGRTQAAAAVEAMVDVVLREVAAGGAVGITGFGTFEKVDRAPRTGRNPRTGEPVPIAGTSSPRFRPGAYFKDVVADPSMLPAQGLAGARVGSDGSLERTGAPTSVRRGSAAATTDQGCDDQDPGPRDRRAGAGQGLRGGRGGGSRGVSGTPASVRRDAATGEDARSVHGRSEAPVPATGRLMAGGEDITLGMIWAKKAQLAQVKNDELAAQRQKKEKAGKKKVKKEKASKDRAREAKRGKKGRKPE
jgi:DNA-binding protein HU-beta